MRRLATWHRLISVLCAAAAWASVGFAHADTARPPPVVQANGETLVGTFDAERPQVASFKGIPFAAPPVGDLRWREPRSHVPRPGRQDASAFAAGCHQDSYNIDWYRRVGRAFGASESVFVNPRFDEDCLYLNVWTPWLTRDAKRPVMVWIYGGANQGGWSFEPNYHGARLAARGDVVVVTLAYRVGVFGFFGHPELRGTTAPANFGLLDQAAALRWVRDNIAQFGGNPDNVTVFGESAGGSNIGYLVTLPTARDLFRRAISQSGGFQLLDRGTLADAEQAGRSLSAALPGQPGIEALRRLPAPLVWETARRALPSQDYSPVVDGVHVLETPAVAYARSGIRHDLLLGSNEDEWYMYFDADPDGLRKDLATLPADAHAALTARAAKEHDVRSGRDKAFTFLNMVCPAYLMAASVHAQGHKAFLYRFTRVRPGPGGVALRSYHGAEIPYVFDTHDTWLTRDATDDALTQRMQEAWTRFAWYGDPAGPAENDSHWPAFDPARPRVMELGDRSGPRSAPDHALCVQWAGALYPGWGPPAHADGH